MNETSRLGKSSLDSLIELLISAIFRHVLRHLNPKQVIKVLSMLPLRSTYQPAS